MPQCKFSLYLKKAGLASRNIVHFFKKVILRCIGLCFNYHHLYLLSRLDQPLIQRIPAGLSSTVACLDISLGKTPFHLAMKVSFGVAREEILYFLFVCVLKWSLKGKKKSSGHIRGAQNDGMECVRSQRSLIPRGFIYSDSILFTPPTWRT